MKVLLDACVPGDTGDALVSFGHAVERAGDWPEDPGDEEILRRASASGQVLVTLDKDFGELAVVRGQSHAGIVRLVGFPASELGKVCGFVLLTYGEELSDGALVTAAPGRVRIRRAGA